MAQGNEVDPKVNYGKCLVDFIRTFEDKRNNDHDEMSRILSKGVIRALRAVKETAEKFPEYRMDSE